MNVFYGGVRSFGVAICARLASVLALEDRSSEHHACHGFNGPTSARYDGSSRHPPQTRARTGIRAGQPPYRSLQEPPWLPLHIERSIGTNPETFIIHEMCVPYVWGVLFVGVEIFHSLIQGGVLLVWGI